jgi:hypothetical protein
MLPVDYFSSVLIDMARKASRNAVDGSLEKEEQTRLPVTKEKILWMREKLWSKGIDERMTYLGVPLGFHFMLRISEYAHIGSEYDSKSMIRRFIPGVSVL